MLSEPATITFDESDPHAKVLALHLTDGSHISGALDLEDTKDNLTEYIELRKEAKFPSLKAEPVSAAIKPSAAEPVSAQCASVGTRTCPGRGGGNEIMVVLPASRRPLCEHRAAPDQERSTAQAPGPLVVVCPTNTPNRKLRFSPRCHSFCGACSKYSVWCMRTHELQRSRAR